MKIMIDTDISLKDIYNMTGKNVLMVNREYQRGETWTKLQKQMFIDSLLRGYHAPAFYFHYKTTIFNDLQNNIIEIIDGQQRVAAICAFLDDGFALLEPNDDRGFRIPNFMKGRPCGWGGKRFSELDRDIRDEFLDHKLVAYEIRTDDDNEVRDLFIRLQGGVPLTPQDKRDAWPGHFTEFVLTAGGKEGVDKWHGWDFFKNCVKQKDQGKRRMLVAQSYMSFHYHRHHKIFRDIKSAYIDQFYHEQIDFDKESESSQIFKKICELLYEEFQGHPKLLGHHIIHLILLIDGLLKDYPNHWRRKLAKALSEFKDRCEEGKQANKKRDVENEYFSYYQNYVQWTSRSSDAASKIRERHVFFVTKMLEILQIAPKDGKRFFSEIQREAVYYNAERLCQVCVMRGDTHMVDWDQAEFHHVVPHRDGGETSIDNCALVDKECHPLSLDDENRFRQWWSSKKNKTSSQSSSAIPQQRKNKSDDDLERELPPDGTSLRLAYKGERFDAKIENRQVLLDHNSLRFKSLSGAAVSITGTSVNGWKMWDIKLPEGNEWLVAYRWRDMQGK